MLFNSFWRYKINETFIDGQYPKGYFYDDRRKNLEKDLILEDKITKFDDKGREFYRKSPWGM